MKTVSFRLLGAGVALSMLLAPFSAGVGAAPGAAPPVQDDLPVHVLPKWAQPTVLDDDDGQWPIVSEPVVPKISRPLRDLPTASLPAVAKEREISPPRNLSGAIAGTDTRKQDLLAALGVNKLLDSPAPILNFEGQGDFGMFAPPDTTGDVGPNHYFQIVNVFYAVYDKSGNQLAGPIANNALWAELGGPCETDNDGDPIVLYDDMADRWLVSQFAVSDHQHECIAISTSPDPLGTYYLYGFAMPDFPDYPKFGVWRDGYYLGTNTGYANQYYAHVFDRASMLAGRPATLVSFGGNPNFLMPADADGLMPPPSGSPGYFYTFLSGGYPNHPPGVDRLAIYELAVDWGTPAKSTFALVNEIPISAFNYTTCGFFVRECIPQLGTEQRLDGVDAWPMVRLQYRNLGSYEAMVGNFTVDVDGTDWAGIRWFELRKQGTNSWSLYQEGTYAPDSDNRWMGSIAMDGSGNIALGYSVSSGTMHPAIRYATRGYGDPMGTLQAEASLMEGEGSQTGVVRWGDYSAMNVDPVDQCTFWITNEYHDVDDTGFKWNTRIGTFRVPGCTGSLGPVGYLDGTVTDSSAGNPIGGANVEAAGLVPTHTNTTTSEASGYYRMVLPTDTYTITASAYGYLPAEIAGASVVSGTTATVDIALDPASTYVISGYVYDATVGWPLYAEVRVVPSGFPGLTAWSDPVSGYYSITLPGGMMYTFQVNAWVSGYQIASRDIFVNGDRVESFGLNADLAICTAPGYQKRAVTSAYYETFELDDDGFVGSSDWEWDAYRWAGTCSTSYPPAAPHSGTHMWGTVLNDCYNNLDDTSVLSFTVDLSGLESATLSWWDWYDVFEDFGHGEVYVNGDWVYDRATSYIIPTAWVQHSVDIGPYVGGLATIEFRMYAAAVLERAGWYIDDVSLLAETCDPQAGGLVVGNVFDGNYDFPLVGAEVANEDGYVATAEPVPADPAVDDGFYILFSPPGSRTFTGTMTGGYGPDVQTPTVVQSDTVQQDFDLPAGDLWYDPRSHDVAQELGMSVTLPFTLYNLGGLAADFELVELGKGMVGLGPFESPIGLVKPHKQNRLTAVGVSLREQPEAAPLAAGDIIQSWPTNLAHGWGIGYNTLKADMWIGNISVGGGDDLNYRFLTDGTNTGDTIDTSSWVGVFGADMTYNPNSGRLWQLDVGGDDCIHEMDPANMTTTGNTICPAFGVSQRGLAYDPTTDVYFAGGWNDQMVYRFAPDGTILESVWVGLNISGLAYNPDTEHLFAQTSDVAPDTYVLDAANNFALLGQFSVAGLGDGAGMEMDCDGNLWVVDQGNQQVLQVESGETTWSLCSFDVPWLSEDPISGTIPSALSQPIDITFDAGQVPQPGVYKAQLKVAHDTPYYVPKAPVTMTVNPPATWGKLEGTVSSLGHCDVNPAALEGAQVVVENGGVVTLTTDVSGTYSYWLEEGTYTVTVSAAEHETAATAVVVVQQATTREDFDLRWLQPCLSLTPVAMESKLMPGESEAQTLMLTNDGAAPLDFRLLEWEGGIITFTTLSRNAPLGGGPDAFGYTWRDSSEAGGPTFEWIEIAPPAGGGGTPVGLSGADDNYFWPLPLPFPFNFYGTDYYTLAVATNGTLYFQDAYLGLGNVSIPGPNSYGVDTFIAHYWDDLYVTPGEVYYLDDGDKFIIEYYQVGGCCVTPDHGTWQIILFDSGSILFQYADVDMGDANYNHGAGATVGIQGDQTTGLEYSYNTPALTDDLAICFAYPSQSPNCAGEDVLWLSEDPISGTVVADSLFDVSVTFTAFPTMTSGVYTATLVAKTDDPVNRIIDVPVTLTVAGPEVEWEKLVSIDGVPTSTVGPIVVFPSDRVQIVDRVWVTYSVPITFSLTEEWGESLVLTDALVSDGALAPAPGSLTWDVGGGMPNAWHVVTKTFLVTGAAWLVDYVTETLWVEYAYPQPDSRLLALWKGTVCWDVGIINLASDSPVTVGDAMHFTATVDGDGPIIYTWDFNSDGTPDAAGAGLSTVAYTYASTGTYSVTLDVGNGCPSTDATSIAVTVRPVCVEVETVTLGISTIGTIYTDTVVTFSADIEPEDASRPYTYSVDYGAGSSAPAVSSADPLVFSSTFTTTGTHTVEIAVWNCGMTEPVTATVQVEVAEYGVCVDLAGVTIVGAIEGAAGLYTFTTAYSPLTASLPISYAWDDGGTEAMSVRTLGAGTTTLVVTATNCTAAVVTDTHEIVISSLHIYLPLVLRDY